MLRQFRLSMHKKSRYLGFSPNMHNTKFREREKEHFSIAQEWQKLSAFIIRA